MSVFIIPGEQPFVGPFGGGHRQHAGRPFHGGNRFCGQSNVNNSAGFSGFLGHPEFHQHHHPHGPHHHHHGGHFHPHGHGHPFFGRFEREYESEEEEVDQWTQFVQERIQQQQRLAALAAARRQAAILAEQEREQERERRRIRRQREQEQQRQREQQYRQFFEQKRQQRQRRFDEAAEKAASDAFAALFGFTITDSRSSAIAAEEQAQRRQSQWQEYQRKREEQVQQRKKQWEELASQGLATALQFAEWLAGPDEEKDVNEPEASTSQSTKEQESMQVDDQQEQQVPKQVEIQVEKAELSDQDPPEEDIALKETSKEETGNVLFNYALPTDSTQRASLKAEDIQVTFDQPSNSIQIRGLWNNDADEVDHHSTASSTTTTAEAEGYTIENEESVRGRKRSRSPKRSRVSDVDEKTGEEIVQVDQQQQEEDQDGFVNIDSTNSSSTIAAGKQPQGFAKVSLPQGANLANLRAELTDEGFKLYI